MNYRRKSVGFIKYVGIGTYIQLLQYTPMHAGGTYSQVLQLVHPHACRRVWLSTAYAVQHFAAMIVAVNIEYVYVQFQTALQYLLLMKGMHTHIEQLSALVVFYPHVINMI